MVSKIQISKLKQAKKGKTGFCISITRADTSGRPPLDCNGTGAGRKETGLKNIFGTVHRKKRQD